MAKESGTEESSGSLYTVPFPVKRRERVRYKVLGTGVTEQFIQGAHSQ